MLSHPEPWFHEIRECGGCWSFPGWCWGWWCTFEVENVGHSVVVGVWPVRAVAFTESDVGRCRCYVAEFAWWVFPPAWHPFVQEVSRGSSVPEFAGDVECRNGCEFCVG